MKIHSVSLENVKGVSSRTVLFPETGVVVVDGPNEVGKSTIVEALDLLLDPKAKATSKSQAIQALQPVGKDVGPSVSAEVSIGGRRLRIAKQWLRTTSMVLEVLSPMKSAFTGDDAQRELERLVEQDLDRTLFESLRFAQGGEAKTGSLADSAVLQNALDQAAGADMHVQGGADLLGDVEREYLRYFTAKTGRSSGELKQAVATARAAHDTAVQAHTSWQESLALMAKRDEAAEHASVVSARTPVLEVAHRSAEAVAQAARTAQEQISLARSTVDAAKVDLGHARGIVRDRQRVVEAVSARQVALTDVVAEIEVSRQRREVLWVEVEESETALQVARTAADTAGRSLSDLKDRYSLAQEARRLADVQHTCEQIEDLETSLVSARHALAAAHVTPADVAEVLAAQSCANSAQVAADTASTLVSVERLMHGPEITLDGQPVTLEVGGATESIIVTTESEIRIGELARLSIRPSADAEALGEELAAHKARLADLLAATNVADVAAAELAGAENARAQSRVRELEIELKGIMRGRTAHSLRQERDDLLALLGVSAQAAGTDASADTHVSRDEVDAAKLVVAAAQERRSTLEASHEKLARQFSELVSELERADERHSAAEREFVTAQNALLSARAEQADERLVEAATAAESQVNKRKATLVEIAKEHAGHDIAGTEQQLTVAKQDLAAQRDRMTEAQSHLTNLNGRVEQAAGEGRRETYDVAVQVFLQAKRELAAVNRRAQAAAQLRGTLIGFRDEAHNQYVEPYAKAIRRLGRQMHGETFDVTVGPRLVITHRELLGVSVPFDSLSGGAQEQLGLLSRLAVASLVDTAEGAPVIVDDALGYTDPERLTQMGRVLSDPANAAQVIVLTCTPERYASIAGAHRVHLAS